MSAFSSRYATLTCRNEESLLLLAPFRFNLFDRFYGWVNQSELEDRRQTFRFNLVIFAPSTPADLVKVNTLELSNALSCHMTRLSLLKQLILSALTKNPPPELGVGRILIRNDAVAGLYLVPAQLQKSCAPISLGCPPDESNTLELSNALLCHGTWLSFPIQPVVAALSRNPPPELGFGRILIRHEAVAEPYLVFAQLLKSFAPMRASKCLMISSFKIRCIDTWLVLALALVLDLALVLVLALTISSLMRPLSGLIFVTLAHGEC